MGDINLLRGPCLSLHIVATDSSFVLLLLWNRQIWTLILFVIGMELPIFSSPSPVVWWAIHLWMCGFANGLGYPSVFVVIWVRYALSVWEGLGYVFYVVHHVRYGAKSSGVYLPICPNSCSELYLVGTSFKTILLLNSPSKSFACLVALGLEMWGVVVSTSIRVVESMCWVVIGSGWDNVVLVFVHGVL